MEWMFGVEGLVEPRNRELLQLFRNRIMFADPFRSQLLTFMIGDAAILMGTHYPGRERIQGLRLLGDVFVQYYKRGNPLNIGVATDSKTIQLVRGVANILFFGQGRKKFTCAVVAERHQWQYEDFARLSNEHINKVMFANAMKWRIYGWDQVFWACRADGVFNLLA